MKTQKLPFWKRQLPNMITWSRIAAIPLVIFCLEYDSYRAGVWATVVFSIASISDFFDGYFARAYNVETKIGKFLDPVADKLLVTSALVMLIPLGRVSAVLVVLLLSRDLMINGLRAVAAGDNITISPSWTAKWKTASTMTAIPFLMIKEIFGIELMMAGQVLLWIALVLSLISAFDYLKFFFNRPSEP